MRMSATVSNAVVGQGDAASYMGRGRSKTRRMMACALSVDRIQALATLVCCT